MNFDSYLQPVWQLPVCGDDRSGGAHVPTRAKYHCFIDGESVCGHYSQSTEEYDGGISALSGEIASNPQIACSRCFRIWQKRCPEDYEAATLAEEEQNNDRF